MQCLLVVFIYFLAAFIQQNVPVIEFIESIDKRGNECLTEV